MTAAPSDEHFREHVERLRHLYVASRPWQRAGIARQRIQHPEVTANVLITSVSATEGMARAILLLQRTKAGEELWTVYENIRRAGPEQLLREIAKRSEKSPTELFGEESWRLFHWAVQYRNLLIHEATFLNQGDGTWLINAAQRIFLMLEETGRRAGIRVYGKPKAPTARR